MAGLALGVAALGCHLSTIDAHIEHAIRAHLAPQWSRHWRIVRLRMSASCQLCPHWLHAGGLGRRSDPRSWAAPFRRESQPHPVLALVLACESGRSRDGRPLARLTLVAGIALGWELHGSTAALDVERTTRANLGPQWPRPLRIVWVGVLDPCKRRPCRPLREAWVGGDRRSSLGRAWVSSHHACRVSAVLRLGLVSRHRCVRRHRVLSLWT